MGQRCPQTCHAEISKPQQKDTALSHTGNSVQVQINTALQTILIFAVPSKIFRGGNGTPLQYSCLENPMDGLLPADSLIRAYSALCLLPPEAHDQCVTPNMIST